MNLGAMLLCSRTSRQQWWIEDEGVLNELGEELFPTGEGPEKTTNAKVSPNTLLIESNT